MSLAHSRVDSGPYWQLARPLMTELEAPVHCAHLRCVQGSQDLAGTLFLTTRQLIWISVDPREPDGSSFQIPFADLLTVERPSRLAVFRAFRVVVEEDGRPLDIYFFPTQRTDVERMLCDQMFLEVEARLDADLGPDEQAVSA